MVLFTANFARGQSAASVTIQANQPGAVISSNLFGIFFEEINFGGEGGIYAEMIRNRSFYNPASANYWTLVTQGTGTGTMVVDPSRPLNTNIPNSLKLTMQFGAGSVGAGNSGFWGMSLQSGATYDLMFQAAASNGFTGPLNARLESSDGSSIYAQTSFNGLTTNWQHFTASLVSSGTDTNGRIVLSISNAGVLWLGVVSLFPRATFNSRTNGLRLDLANMLAAMKPSFLRFPGGNFIESFNVTNAVRWKKSIGDLSQRPGHLNDSWGYCSTDGFGAHEFFQFCEDMGMEPLYDINCGLMLGYNGNTNNTVPLDQMGPWVQDALDLIQYANGDTSTYWGAQRAANGHPVPFNLKCLEIGNENGGPYYDPRYSLFYDAIKSNYPAIRLISPVWGSPSSPTSRPVEIRDEHYYASPATFISYATKYDNYSRSGPKVFVGEYAVTSGYGAYGNLAAALGEAVFMTGMERNSDVVQLASYAPLFANVNGIQWHPDLIYYDSSRCFGTPSYYVQKLFSQNRGDIVLPATVSITSAATNPPPHGAIGLGSWSTAVQYTNLVVTSNGVTLYQSDFINQGTNGWRVYGGTWRTNAGLYQQTALVTDCRTSTGNTNWANYTLSLRARKLSGSEGFLILFNWTDDNNWTWWNVGGWGNTLDGVEQMAGGGKSLISGQVAQTIATNTWYDISVVLTNYTILCYLNGSLVQTVSYPATSSTGLFASSVYNQASGQIIVKAVNPYSQPMSTTFNLNGVNSIAPAATVIQLTSASPSDENSLIAPTNVFPATNAISNAGTNFTVTLPANSLSILRLQAGGINFLQPTNVPAVLVHRYSFNDGPGSATAADSIGGAAWNGTLPNGGTFSNGQLSLAAATKQFLQLPAGILSNYAAVTIEAWATFPNQLPVNCFFYGFGNTNGTSGVNYIFCAPRAGRIAITSGNYASEQNAAGAGDFSFHTNYHIMAVYNPPAGYLALYTNGVLAAINNSVTIQFSSVSNLYSWIGRSLYSGDPYPDFSLDEFRIYSGALRTNEIAATQALGPGQLLSNTSPLMNAIVAGGNLTLSWPLSNAGFTLMTRTNLVLGDWTAAPSPGPQIVGSQWQVTIPISGGAWYYRLARL